MDAAAPSRQGPSATGLAPFRVTVRSEAGAALALPAGGGGGRERVTPEHHERRLDPGEDRVSAALVPRGNFNHRRRDSENLASFSTSSVCFHGPLLPSRRRADG